MLGFTLTELLITMGIIAVLAGIVLGAIARTRAIAQSVNCLSNLRQIGAAFTQYAADNDKLLPDPLVNDTSWENSLRKYLSNPDVFRCPADAEIFPSVGSSYDWRDTGRDDTTLAGRRISDIYRSDAVLGFETLPGWHVKRMMNAVYLDGSARTVDEDTCLGDVRRAIRDASSGAPVISR